MTATDQAEAETIAEALINQRLAACVNILGGIRSVFHWNGGVDRDDEVALTAKTRADLVDRITTCVTSLHSYDCPCIVSIPIDSGHAPFLDWIAEETAQASAGSS